MVTIRAFFVYHAIYSVNLRRHSRNPRYLCGPSSPTTGAPRLAGQS